MKGRSTRFIKAGARPCRSCKIKLSTDAKAYCRSERKPGFGLGDSEVGSIFYEKRKPNFEGR
jgi:hypothetical protein